MATERTADGHFLVIGGRRWRAQDPHLPENLAAELVSELMAARRAVRDAGGDDERGAARRRVQDAKVALGERGRPWWQEPTAHSLTQRAQAATRALLRHRAPESSICPSDVARIVSADSWRQRMDQVRDAVADLVDDGQVRVTRREAEVDVRRPGGPVRIRRGGEFPV